MLRRILFASALLGLAACGSPPADSYEPADSASAGGEAPETESPPVEEEPAVAAPIVMRVTVPVPVPQPAVPRDDLSPELEAVWAAVESQVQLTRPEAPEENTRDNVEAWSRGPFTAWVDAHREALVGTRDLLAQINAEPTYERALALALFAYAIEDFAAQIGGAPVPDDIAADDELRTIYIESLNDVTVPLGQRAVELYADCQARLAALGDESAWLPWRAYCVQRGQEVIEGYGLAPSGAASEPEALPSESEPGEPMESNPSDL